jgi:hypothetical protein
MTSTISGHEWVKDSTYKQLIEAADAANATYDQIAAQCRAAGDLMVALAAHPTRTPAIMLAHDSARAEFDGLSAHRAEQGRLCRAIADEIAKRVEDEDFA